MIKVAVITAKNDTRRISVMITAARSTINIAFRRCELFMSNAPTMKNKRMSSGLPIIITWLSLCGAAYCIEFVYVARARCTVPFDSLNAAAICR